MENKPALTLPKLRYLVRKDIFVRIRVQGGITLTHPLDLLKMEIYIRSVILCNENLCSVSYRGALISEDLHTPTMCFRIFGAQQYITEHLKEILLECKRISMWDVQEICVGVSAEKTRTGEYYRACPLEYKLLPLHFQNLRREIACRIDKNPYQEYETENTVLKEMWKRLTRFRAEE